VGLIQKTTRLGHEGSLTEAAKERALSLIEGVTEYAALSNADIVIEAVFETCR